MVDSLRRRLRGVQLLLGDGRRKSGLCRHGSYSTNSAAVMLIKLKKNEGEKNERNFVLYRLDTRHTGVWADKSARRGIRRRERCGATYKTFSGCEGYGYRRNNAGRLHVAFD